MYGLSDEELQVLQELWKLIQAERTTQMMPSEDFGSRTTSTPSQKLDDPLDRRSDEYPAPPIRR